MKKLLIALVVLVLLALGLDRGGVFVAERVAGSKLQASQGLDERPDVDIHGFPFLDQVVEGRYGRIDVDARDVPLGEGQDDLRLARLEVSLMGVTTSRDFSEVDVARARASAVLTYDDLSDALGIELSSSGDGQLSATRTFSVLGQDVSPSITVAPTIVDGALSFGEFSVNGAADAAGVVSEVLDEVFGVAVPLQGIPFDVDVDGVSVRRDGLRLELSGSDLTYTTS